MTSSFKESKGKNVFVHIKSYYKIGDYLHSIFNDEKMYRIIAELDDGYLVVFHGYFNYSLGSSVEFINKESLGAKKEFNKL